MPFPNHPSASRSMNSSLNTWIKLIFKGYVRGIFLFWGSQVLLGALESLNIKHFLPSFCMLLQSKQLEKTSLAVQWLRFCPPIAGGAGSIPGRGSSACRAVRPPKQTNKNNNNKKQVERTSTVSVQYQFCVVNGKLDTHPGPHNFPPVS